MTKSLSISVNQPVKSPSERWKVWAGRIKAKGLGRVRVTIPLDPESVAAIKRHAAHLRAKHRAAMASKK